MSMSWLVLLALYLLLKCVGRLWATQLVLSLLFLISCSFNQANNGAR